MSKERPLQSMAIVIGPCWKLFKRRILAAFGFNRTALLITQPKLHSMFCVLFLKIALSAADLMSFGHFGAAIWHHWTNICGVTVKDKCYADKPETIDALKDNTLYCTTVQNSWNFQNIVKKMKTVYYRLTLKTINKSYTSKPTITSVCVWRR